ncbi:uncharacterized protein LOC113330171 [Papaver somniferum]|uniref:uncharacterized protein LOC113330171 n=1 Tax=Papaver somniferum TaxID=3469 RepID=UPI000E6FD072|nr:uncharacterized protein LOC113330171 [Papaver somniferum]
MGFENLFKYGKDYEYNTPVKLLDKHLYAMAETEDEQLVVISQVLVSQIYSFDLTRNKFSHETKSTIVVELDTSSLKVGVKVIKAQIQGTSVNKSYFFFFHCM